MFILVLLYRFLRFQLVVRIDRRVFSVFTFRASSTMLRKWVRYRGILGFV